MRMMELPEKLDANKIYDILVKHCGALENQRNDFAYILNTYMSGDKRFPFEFRFMGKLGMGGKLKINHYTENHISIYVCAYSEDITPKIQKMIDEATRLIHGLMG